MKRLSNNLLILLAAQLLVVVWIFWPRAEQGAADAGMALLDINSAEISKVVVSDSSNSVLLSRGASGWQLPEYHNLKADPTKLERLLDTLPSLSRGFVVAQSAGAKQRFEVAEDSYQRRVQYNTETASDGATAAELYLGTSPGFRKVHTRVGQEDQVYSVEFNSFDLPATAAEWLDQTLLQLEDVQVVQGLDYQLSRQGDSWQDEAGRVADSATADSLLNGLQGLRVSGATDLATAKILKETEVPATLTVNTTGASYEYRLYEIEEAHYIKRGDIPIYFNVSAYDYDRLNDVSAESLFPVAEELSDQALEDTALEPETDPGA